MRYLMAKTKVILLVAIGLLLCLTGCCSHVWTEANCTSPKTCTECGATEGDVVHTFEIVNCTEPPVCNGCGATGEIIGHTWIDATCDKPKFCSVCDETEGDAIGHSTRCGDCERCGEYINIVAYKDGFAVVTYSDTTWMQEHDDFTDVYVIGAITQISKTNDMSVVDSEGKHWTVGVGTGCDLSFYIGTECEVYGFSTGGISSQHKTPYINMSHDDNRIVFADGKELYPEDFESTQQFSNKYSGGTASGGNGNVWIPTDGGTQYHSKATCSGMYAPQQVSRVEAESAGFGRCGKCW